MCGLFGGYSSILLPEERNVIQSLMIYNYARGEDSCGMMDFAPDAQKKIGKTTAWRYWKTTDNPMDFARGLFLKAEEDRWKKASPRLIAGHARAATRGKITQNNAHPFYHKPVIGMHNGTIYGPFAHHLDHETDSEALIRNISEMGVKDAIKDLGSAHSAAYALVWINYRDATLNFLRNDKRPLHFARQKNGNTLFWSSEALQLRLALSYLKDGETFEISELPKDKHYCFDVSPDTFSEPVIEEVRLPITTSYYPTTTSMAMGFHGWTEAEWNDYQAEYNRKQTEKKAAEHGIPWEKYPDEDAETPDRVTLGAMDGLTEQYVAQYSSEFKNGIFNRWDLVTQRWYTVWGWLRLNSIRRERKEAGKQSSLPLEDSSEPRSSSADLNDNLPDMMKPGYEEPVTKDSSFTDHWVTAAPWYVDGEEVEYKDWLAATKNGCTWERCIFIHNTEAIWINKEYVLCEKHAREALNKKSELNEHFRNHAAVIKNGLKGFKRRLLNEIAIRSSTPDELKALKNSKGK